MKGLSTSQIEKLMQIADYLREEREKRAISLEEIAIKTFIPLRLLQALDEGQIERLPEPVFVQGFIRRYADSLGLEGMALAKTFSVESSPTEPPATSPEPKTNVLFLEDRPKEPKSVNTPSTLQTPANRTGGLPVSYTPYVLAGSVAILVLAVGGFGIFRSLDRNSSQEQQAEAIAANRSPDAVPSSPSTPETQASPSPLPEVPQTQTSPSNSPIQVAIDLKDGDSWMEIVVDGKTEFEGTLRQGTQQSWTAQNELVLISGNAGAVYVTYNQSEKTKLGSIGQVKEMVFPPKGDTFSQTNTQTSQ